MSFWKHIAVTGYYANERSESRYCVWKFELQDGFNLLSPRFDAFWSGPIYPRQSELWGPNVVYFETVSRRESILGLPSDL